ncbi:MAG TPA: BamA/TamA family outer membrane protein, partial [Acidobacteriota bacterium]|nr:BamA/TamA family outer membrane protein [Acidobacteriota bacterium]
DNLWGLARTGSLQAYGSSKRSGLRATIEDRHLDEDLLEGLGTLGIEREERDGFTLETTGIALQLASPQQRRGTRVQLRYELEDNRFTNVTLDPDAIQQVLSDEGRRLDKIRLGGFLGTLILDRRDDPFLPTRGWIARAEAGIWGKALLSEATFARVTGQVAGYVPKGRLTLAGSTRFGLAWPFKDTAAVPLSQRFFAGGADSMRGFARDKVGPLDGPGGNALGGESMLVTNLEARYRFWGRAHAVVFYDVGNVWERASDFYKGKLRKAAGVGVQYATPFGALRAEYGWKLDRQEGESPGQFFVSIGEAF